MCCDPLCFSLLTPVCSSAICFDSPSPLHGQGPPGYPVIHLCGIRECCFSASTQVGKRVIKASEINQNLLWWTRLLRALDARRVIVHVYSDTTLQYHTSHFSMRVALNTFSNYDPIRGSLALWECTWGLTSSRSTFGLSYFYFRSPLKEARSLFSPHRFQWDRVIAFSAHTMTPQRDLDCSPVSLPLSPRLDAHPGGMWFVSRYKTSPLENYITSTSHKGLARGRRMLLLVQLPSEICELRAAGNILSLSWAHMCAQTVSLMCMYTDTCLQMHKYFSVFVLMHTCRGRNSLIWLYAIKPMQTSTCLFIHAR